VSDDRRAESPGTPREKAQHDAEARQTEKLQCLEVHEREHQRGHDDRESRPKSRPDLFQAVQERAQEQTAEEQLLDDRAADAHEHGQHDEARPERVAREALGRVAEPCVEMVDERKQRCLDHRDEQVLGSDAGDDP